MKISCRKIGHSKASLGAMMLIVSSTAMATPVYTVDVNDQLTSVSGIEIAGYGGYEFTVDFVEGTLSSFLAGGLPFYWAGWGDKTNKEWADMLSYELLNNVISTASSDPKGREVDIEPEKMYGIQADYIDWGYAQIIVPTGRKIAFIEQIWDEIMIFENAPEPSENNWYVDNVNQTLLYNRTLDTKLTSVMVWARWTVDEVSNEVPEPASLALMALGALGLSVSARRRRSTLPR